MVFTRSSRDGTRADVPGFHAASREAGHDLSTMKTQATFLLALALAGCATVETGGQTWYREGGTADEQSAALGAAEVQAKQAHVLPAEERDIVIRSMTAQGWRLIAKDSAPALKQSKARKSLSSPTTGTAIP